MRGDQDGRGNLGNLAIKREDKRELLILGNLAQRSWKHKNFAMASAENRAPAHLAGDATAMNAAGKAKSRTEMLREWREAKKGTTTSKRRFALQTIASGVSCGRAA